MNGDRTNQQKAEDALQRTLFYIEQKKLTEPRRAYCYLICALSGEFGVSLDFVTAIHDACEIEEQERRKRLSQWKETLIVAKVI